MSNDFSKIVKYCLGAKYSPKNKYIIAIQGCSTSGKTTLASSLAEELKSNGCKPFLINVDNYYKDMSNVPEIVNNKVDYDYDNPAAIYWDRLVQNLKGLIRGDKIVRKSSYDFVTKKRTEIEEENIGFNIIIIEGIFGHNVFNENIFNIEEYDCFSTTKEIQTSFIPNHYNLGDFLLLKIFLDVKNEIILNTRKMVDNLRDGKSPSESQEMVEKYVLPSTNKWVRPTAINSSDIVLPNGTRDIHLCSGLFKSISHFFGLSLNSSGFELFLEKLSNEPKSQAIAN